MAVEQNFERIITQTIPTIKFENINDTEAITLFIIKYGGKVEQVDFRPKDENFVEFYGWHKDEVASWKIFEPNSSGYVYRLMLKPGDVVAYKNNRFEIAYIENLESLGFKEV